MALGLGSRCAALAVGLALAAIEAQAAQEELNALVWCDHTDPALLEPFEEQFDVKVNVKDYEGTGTALALIEQSQPGDWDVFVVDSVDVPRVVEAGLLAPLPEEDFPWADIFSELRQEDLHFKDGKMYAVPEKFGYNTLAYNRTRSTRPTCARRPCCGSEIQGPDRRLRLLHAGDGHGGDRARHEAVGHQRGQPAADPREAVRDEGQRGAGRRRGRPRRPRWPPAQVDIMVGGGEYRRPPGLPRRAPSSTG